MQEPHRGRDRRCTVGSLDLSLRTRPVGPARDADPNVKPYNRDSRLCLTGLVVSFRFDLGFLD